ncbi:hypothetical protein NHX12_031951 [Muraenolepis orangiensis]|uniref:protein-tyrosine-phosphatase n=1 Tax=Muraenolepis orangiensis TaxID=630683 RepID=A0A9Q0E8F8_9TELE|nr:hypothetical protein NHX12_031951 [Muraenolepis orangiensis]
MVFHREEERERPPLSLILPHLYLGAERDVTQDSLGSRGISFVLSVSRCSPQPSFLPAAHYLRVPIDDSLRDDLLPWIPAALRFIDGAMSSGGAVLVHCAAGISRSPALAVAYIMYSRGMDLDHAYRFVKERRPSISPNFNFLGQLQHFQGSLNQKSSDGSLVIQPLHSPHTDPSGHLTSPLPSPSPGLDYQGNRLLAGADTRGEQPTHTEEEEAAQRCFRWGEAQNHPPEETRSLSRKLQTLNLTLNLNQSVRMLRQLSSPSPCYEAAPSVPEPRAPLEPTVHASLLEKRKSLTLSLSGPTPPGHQAATPHTEGASIPDRRKAHHGITDQYSESPAGGAGGSAALEARGPSPAREGGRGESPGEGEGTESRRRRSQPSPEGQSEDGQQKRGEEGGGDEGGEGKRGEGTRGEAARMQRSTNTTTTPIVDQQPSAETQKTSSSTRGPEEQVVEDQSPLSPLNLTLNKLLGWGERMLLGVLLGPQIKMGQAALPYRC